MLGVTVAVAPIGQEPLSSATKAPGAGAITRLFGGSAMPDELRTVAGTGGRFGSLT